MPDELGRMVKKIFEPENLFMTGRASKRSGLPEAKAAELRSAWTGQSPVPTLTLPLQQQNLFRFIDLG
jgi:hypothetical protein